MLDVGIIEGRGRAVVEFNECRVSGIYSCDRERVLATLVAACVPADQVDERWDFRRHYFTARESPSIQ